MSTGRSSMAYRYDLPRARSRINTTYLPVCVVDVGYHYKSLIRNWPEYFSYLKSKTIHRWGVGSLILVRPWKVFLDIRRSMKGLAENCGTLESYSTSHVTSFRASRPQVQWSTLQSFNHLWVSSSKKNLTEANGLFPRYWPKADLAKNHR